MRVRLTDVLELASFRAAGIEVLVGDVDGATVRWVHSSEVFEMGGLLAGGEILLTTGLGLHGCDDAQLAQYVEELAASGCVALGLELGRSFLHAPQALIDAARRHEMVLLTLSALVPFERMTEDFCELIIARRLGDAADSQGWVDLVDLVVAGAGTRSLLDQVARMAGCAVELLDAEGHVVERSRIRTIGHEGDDGVLAPIRGRAMLHGHVRLCGRSDEHRRRLAERAASALALELARHRDSGWRPTPGQQLVSDLSAGELVSHPQALQRLVQAGVTRQRHVEYCAVVIDGSAAPGELLAAVEQHWPDLTGPLAAGTVGNHVIAVLTLSSSWKPDRIRRVVREATGVIQRDVGAGHLLTVGIATGGADGAELSAAVRRAREIVRLAPTGSGRSQVLMARDVGVQRLVSAMDPERVAEFIDEQIGSLIEHDRDHRTPLLRTLDAYLSRGCSKVAAAQALGVGRQALYDRLGRIEKLLGVDLNDPAQVAGLQLAVFAWRTRTGLDPQVGFTHQTISG